MPLANSYSLTDISAVAGTFKLKLYSDQAGLTVPTFDTVLSIGERTETLNRELGVSELETLELEFRDDYSTYSEGFWYKVMSGDWELRLLLSEGGTDKFYFYGIPQPESITWREHFIGSSRIRMVRVTFLAAISKIYDTLTSAWLDEAYAQRVNTGLAHPTSIYDMIALEGMFAALLKASGLNSDYALSYVDFVYDASNKDIKWKIGAVVYTYEELYIAVTYTTAPATPVKTHYFNSAHADHLAKRWDKAIGLASAMLKNFGLAMRMDYNTATEKHKIQLIQRAGRAYSGTLNFSSREKSSEILPHNFLVGDAVRFTHALSATSNYAWMSKRFGGTTVTLDPTEPPDYIEFDLDETIPFIVESAMPAGNAYGVFATVGLPTAPVLLDGMEVFNYESGVFFNTTTAEKMQEGLCKYWFHRFTPVYKSFIRRYGKIVANAGSGDTFTALGILRRTSINDGVAAENYYVNRVTIIPETNEIEIEWLEEA